MLAKLKDSRQRKPKLKGLCSDLGVRITEDDIDGVRQEIGRNSRGGDV